MFLLSIIFTRYLSMAMKMRRKLFLFLTAIHRKPGSEAVRDDALRCDLTSKWLCFISFTDLYRINRDGGLIPFNNALLHSMNGWSFFNHLHTYSNSLGYVYIHTGIFSTKFKTLHLIEHPEVTESSSISSWQNLSLSCSYWILNPFSQQPHL
jgi:hypothetical protein